MDNLAYTLGRDSDELRIFHIGLSRKKPREIKGRFTKVTEQECERSRECTNMDINVMLGCPHNERKCGDETPTLQPCPLDQ
jgi:hypothetical protein